MSNTNTNIKLKQSLIEDYKNPNLQINCNDNSEYRTLRESVWQSLVVFY